MDTRRMIIAVCISFGLLFGWQYLSVYMGWMPEPVPPQEAPAQPKPGQGPLATQQTGPVSASSIAPITATPGKDITVSTPLYKAIFNSNGGYLKSFELKKYDISSVKTDEGYDKPFQFITPEAASFAPMGLLINGMASSSTGQWSYSGPEEINVAEGANATLTLKGQVNNIGITRVISFDPATYLMKEQVTLQSDTAQMVGLGYTMGTSALVGPNDYNRATSIAHLQNNSLENVSDTSDLSNGKSYDNNLGWGGIMSTYFIAAVIPADNALNLTTRLQNDVYRVAFKKSEITLPAGQSITNNVSYYLGPKFKANLEAAPNNLIDCIDYGYFGWMAKPLLNMLKFFYSYVHNYGIAIILLTVVIKLVLWPLSYKSYKSMQGMKKVQPLMTKIREKYKDDKQRMNQEMMQLYKTYKINPMGGCLPILVQLPVFFGLYQALLNAIELRHASFIEHLPGTDIAWLADLSIMDPLYITPLVMGASMFLQQKLTPTPGDPTQAKIMMFMPIIFTVMFINFPSGLVVYWLVNNLISIAQQWWQLRLKAD